MSTTIDSLQIDIQTSSTNASAGIRDLAKSLGELKSSGAIGVATKNLKNLSDTLAAFKDASNATRSIGKLSGAMERLKSVGSLTGIANSIKKLSDNLGSIGNVSIDDVAPKIERIAAALAPLSAVKSGGINTMMNGLKKLGDVTKSLDDDTIAAFTERIEKLNDALGPLSQKMTTVQAGFKGINAAVKQTNVSVEQANTKVNVSVFNLSNLINVIQGVVQALEVVVQKLTEAISQAIEWDGIAARFGRGFGAQAEETYAWIQRLNEEMGINVQQFMQYSSVYATMLTGFGVAMEDAGKMALGYTELTYDIWAGYNDVYAGFADAAEAVKSAIAGEVEPIRRAGFTIVESTLEQTAANYGLSISLEKATEAEKSYLRYLTLVDQARAQGLVGTYAKELGTAEGLMRTFSQQLKSLAQAFGSLFLPILVEVMPYIQAFVELLTDAVKALAALFGITIQGVDWSGYETGVGGATDSTDDFTDSVGSATNAVKELKNATLGMDELNVISPPSNGGSGGAGGGSGGTGFEDLDVDSLWDDSIFADIGNQVDAIKEKLKDWLPVIETVGAVLGALGIALLLAQLGEGMEAIGKMDGLVGGLKQTLAGLAILTIEAVLVFMLADEYLESGNLLALVGEALATAAGGYLMYKGFGDKGLIMSLAVSIAAQLAAIALNLADGGVEIDDPELWIQSAFTTALGGAAGGWLAYKGLIKTSTGKGVGLGLLATLSLSLSAITVGEVAANNEVTGASIWTALGSIVSAAGFGFTVGGVWGAVIGAAAALVLNIVGAIAVTVSKNTEEAMVKDLKSRFGDIELSVEETKAYVDKITAIPREVEIDANVWNEALGDYEVQTMTVPVDVALSIFDSENATLEKLRKTVNNLAEKVSRDAMKIMLGIEVSPEDYAASIDAYVLNAQEYLDQYYLTTSIAIGISSGETGGDLTASLSDFYSANSAELQTLGTKLKQAVSDAFVDGEWIPDKLQEALELQAEIQEIIDYTSDVEYRATIQNLKLSISGTDLTPESFSGVLEGSKEAIEKKLESLEEIKMSKLQVAIMQYDANIAEGMSEAEAKKIYETTVADIEAEYQKGKIEVTYGTVDFGLETLQTAFAAEIERVKNDDLLNVDLALDYALDTNLMFNENGIYEGIYQMTGEMAVWLHSGIQQHVDPAARDAMAGLIEEMKPTMAEYEEIAAAGRKAGTTVTESVRQGLNDYNQLAAIAGEADAINYLIGQGFSTDPTFLQTLATSKTAGQEIDESIAEGLLNNMNYVYDEASGLIVGIRDTVNNKTIQLTPEMENNLANLGVNLGDALGDKYQYVYDETTGVLQSIVDSTTGNSVWVNSELKEAGKNAGEELSAGVLDGAESGMESDKKSWLDWAIWPWNWFKQKNEINSPSKLFERGGKYLTDGLKNGLDKNSLSGKLSDIWANAKSWWDKKGNLKTYTPNIGSIYEKVKERWDSAKTWWNEKKSAMKQYTPSIGSIYEKVYDRWKNARDWWNSKKAAMKTYTPSIGSITDKLKSAWNSAKSWWNKNVKLSTKLNVQVPTIKVKWDTASAFGKSFKYPTGFSLKFAADGGIFDAGSLIWAGERGAEVVANAGGGKTGVMNVQQMQDAVYEGVYAAVVAAMRASGGSGQQGVNVYLDGRQITATVEQRQRERGASIMGTQVYSY